MDTAPFCGAVIYLTERGMEKFTALKKLIPKNQSKKIIIDFDRLSDREIGFQDLIGQLLGFLDKYEVDFNIKIKNLPCCLFPPLARDHILASQPELLEKRVKVSDCRLCKFNSQCPGFSRAFLKSFGFPPVEPIKDLPDEIMIEVESKCNFNCYFCYNKNSFAKDGRNIQNLESDYIKKIIDEIKRTDIKIVRFTGGEPLLRKDILELMKYAKSKDLEVRLNTNASLINEALAKDLAKLVDNVLIPLEDVNCVGELSITGFPGSFSKKIKAIKLLKKYKTKIVRCGTVATRKNIKNLEKFFKLVLELNLDEWELYRPISATKNKKLWSFNDVKILIEKLIKFRKISGRTFRIANGVPFCSYDKNKVNSVSAGALSEDGHIRFVIDPRGFVKPHYYFNKNIGDPLDILACWNHPFMKKMRNLEFAPKECKNCSFLEKCRGGSRFLAKLYSGRWNAKDSLMPKSKRSSY